METIKLGSNFYIKLKKTDYNSTFVWLYKLGENSPERGTEFGRSTKLSEILKWAENAVTEINSGALDEFSLSVINSLRLS